MLAGERVTLRPTRPDDVATFYEWRLDLATWGATTDKPPYPMTFALYQEQYDKAALDEGRVDFAIEVGGTLVGRAGMFAFDELARNAEVGISFGPEHRGKGYGTEALRVLCAFAFDHRNLHRLWLETLATNEAAIRCYARVGFTEEGRLREQAWVDGTYVDMVRMGLLRDEWIASAP